MGSHDEEICAALARVALAGDGVVLGIGVAVLAIRTWLRFYSHSKALKKLENTSVSRISDLRSLVVEETSGNYDSRSISGRGETDIGGNRSLRPENRQQDDPLVIVRGKVSTKSAVDSQWRRKEDELLTAHNAGNKGVIVKRTQTCLYNEWRGLFGWSSDWRGLLGWGSLKEQVTVSMRKVPFVLVEGNGFHSMAFAHINIDESSHPLPLVTVYHQLHPVQASPYTLLQAIFGRGYPVGLLDEEKVLPPGKEITAVGILSFAQDGQPVIKSSKHLPCFLTELRREQLVAEIAIGTKVLFWTGIVFSTVAMGVLGYAVFKNWQRWKNWRLQRERQREQARQDRLSVEAVDEDIADLPDGELCVVCLLRRRRAAFLPCGHLVCCVCCAQRVEQDENARCPVCRQNVNGTIRIYDA